MIKLIPRVENSKMMILLSPLLALTLTALSALIIFILDDIKVSSVFFTLFVGPLTDSYYFSELLVKACLLYTSPSPRDRTRSRMPSSA